MPIAFKIDDSDIEQFEDHLKTFGRRAYPFATRNTLNNAGFKAQEISRKDIRVKMVTRNKFTERSVLVDRARTLNVSRQSATVGSIADYMDEQEFGGVKRKTGREGVPIATGFSAGQEGQQPRTRVPRKGNKLANIQLRKRRRRPKTNKQALLFKVQDAVTSGKRFIFHDFEGNRKKGIFRVVGGGRKFKRGWPTGAKLRMVHDMTEQSVNIPRNPWLKPAVDRTQVLMPAMHIKSLRFQLKRLGLFK